MGTIITIFVEAFATHDWQIYVGSLPGIATACITTLARSMITKLVGSSEIGKVLAVNGCIQVVLTSYSIYLYFLTYRTRAIITRGLYSFYPLFEVQKRFFKGLFS